MAAIERSAVTRARVVMWGGLLLLVGNLGLFVRLTYYELSWSVENTLLGVDKKCGYTEKEKKDAGV
jgi:polyferredoxin